MISAFLTGAQGMSVLLVQGPHFESLWFRESSVNAFFKSPRDLQKSELPWFLWTVRFCFIS